LTSQLADVERARYVWEEYRYRHDLIWRLLFRMTAAAVLLSIAPFTIDDLVAKRAGAWVDALPAIALALVAISWLVLVFELRMFKPIDGVYKEVQQKAVGLVRDDGPGVLPWVVRLYPAALLVLLFRVALVAW
jgi:hypothetical protein